MRIVVYGIPAPQGSKNPMRNKHTGKLFTQEVSPKLTPWRQDVKATAEAVLDDLGRPAPFTGAVVMRLVFTFNRPPSVKRSKRPWPSVYPDLDKLARGVLDALKAAGVLKDDCLVVEFTRLAKVYAGEDPEALDRPGALILIGELVDSEAIGEASPGR
ncbi:MAG TPA: RusA family crossover junction endodeoxyribonuclease [Gemmatimonadales bacterium]|nr:RusA family crossover junction endodeoxyribonuclease [Gemmatimonadales bacterium]